MILCKIHQSSEFYLNTKVHESFNVVTSVFYALSNHSGRAFKSYAESGHGKIVALISQSGKKIFKV